MLLASRETDVLTLIKVSRCRDSLEVVDTSSGVSERRVPNRACAEKWGYTSHVEQNSFG